MKKLISVLLTLAMVLGLVPAVFAADEPTITMSADKDTVAPGETVTLTLSLDKDTVVDGAGFKIDFDKDVYEYVKKVPDTFDDTTNENVANEKGWVRAVYLNTKPSKPTTWSAGQLDTFTFKAKEGVSSSTAKFTLTVENLEKYNQVDPANNIKVAHKVAGGELTIPVQTPITGYTVSLDVGGQITAGEIVEIPVTIGNNDGRTSFNAYDLKFIYDASALEPAMEEGNTEGYRLTYRGGRLRVIRYGQAAELGEVLTLRFIGTGHGSTQVRLTEAYVDANANAREFDAPAATILRDASTIDIHGYLLTLPDDFIRTDAEGSVIEPGSTVTFRPKDLNYKYDPYADSYTSGGLLWTVEVKMGEDGDFFIPDVDRSVKVRTYKKPKSYAVTLGEDITGEEKAVYATDYSFLLTHAEDYLYEMAVTIGGQDYRGFTVQVNEDGTTSYTIPGADITGEIVINSNKKARPLATYSVTFAGSGAGDAMGASSVTEKSTYTFTLNKADNYDYTVTASMGEEPLVLTAGEDNSYSIAMVSADLVITIEKTYILSLEVAVSEYVETDDKTVFLVTATGIPEADKTFAYGENVMYKTTAYGENVYSWLVIADKGQIFTVADAQANITQATATAEEVTQSYDVNETGLVDVNDAQLAYNIYSGVYSDFEKVSVRKFLRADVDLNKSVNVADAVAIIANSLQT